MLVWKRGVPLDAKVRHSLQHRGHCRRLREAGCRATLASTQRPRCSCRLDSVAFRQQLALYLDELNWKGLAAADAVVFSRPLHYSCAHSERIVRVYVITCC